MDIEDLLKLLLLIAALIFVPMLAIWSLNTLFAIGIVLSLKSWGAMVILLIILAFNTGAGGNS